jgi:hypothetical protein
MRSFDVRHGIYINTLSKGYRQKRLDAIKRIVSDFLSGREFAEKGISKFSTLSKGYSDAIKRIVEFEFVAKQKRQTSPSILPESKGAPLILPQGDIRHTSGENVAILSSLNLITPLHFSLNFAQFLPFSSHSFRGEI